MREGDWEIKKSGKGTCSVEKYLGSSAELVIPGKIGEYIPVEIGAKLLKKTSKVRTITIPKTIEYIDPEAFATWRSVESVSADGKRIKSRDGVLYDGTFRTLLFYPPQKDGDDYEAPETLRRVQSGAFSATVRFRTFSFYGAFDEFAAKPSECPRLECFVALSSGAMRCSEGVLFKNSTLVFYPPMKKSCEYSIPEGTESIGCCSEPMFPQQLDVLNVPMSLKAGLAENAGKTGAVNVDYMNSVYASIDGVLFLRKGNKLVLYPEGKKDSFYVAPYGTLSVGEEAFARSHVKSVVLPASLVHIEGNAFYSSDIENIVIPLSVSDIDIRALSGAEHIEKVYVEPRSVGDVFISGSSLSSKKRYAGAI